MSGAHLRITLGIGLLAVALAVVFALSRSPVMVAQANTPEHAFLGTTRQAARICQSGETLPRGTSAVRLKVETFFGPRVTLQVLAHGRVITSGERGSGWTGGVVTVAVKPLPTTRSDLELCFKLLLNGDETVSIVGERTARTRPSSGRISGRVHVEYLRPGHSSWWSLAPEVARRMGLGRAWAGTWNVLLVLVLMGAVVLLCSRAVLRELR